MVNGERRKAPNMPKSLTIRPGRWLQRNGDIAHISRKSGDHWLGTRWTPSGKLHEGAALWSMDGQGFAFCEHDIVGRPSRPRRPAAKRAGVTISRKMLRFLLGEGALDGRYFGDLKPSTRGRYWWRTFLREEVRSSPRRGRG